jgi:hypothetical protein
VIVADAAVGLFWLMLLFSYALAVKDGIVHTTLSSVCSSFTYPYLFTAPSEQWQVVHVRGALCACVRGAGEDRPGAAPPVGGQAAEVCNGQGTARFAGGPRAVRPSARPPALPPALLIDTAFYFPARGLARGPVLLAHAPVRVCGLCFVFVCFLQEKPDLWILGKQAIDDDSNQTGGLAGGVGCRAQ